MLNLKSSSFKYEFCITNLNTVFNFQCRTILLVDGDIQDYWTKNKKKPIFHQFWNLKLKPITKNFGKEH